MSFKNAVLNTPTYSLTANGAKTHSTSGNPMLDYFFLAGASRNQDILNAFLPAFGADPELTLRITCWMRDARGGAGERESYRKVLKYLYDSKEYKYIDRLIPITPIVGRWDDLLVLYRHEPVREMIHAALRDGNALCAKWMPRNGPYAEWLRGEDYSPKQWRKYVVGLSNTVEQLMCSKQWDKINFNHVPSLAAARYQKAFKRNCPHYEAYKAALVQKDSGAKVNASAIFPHDVLKAYMTGDKVVAQAQWDALPNYMDDHHSVLPMVDVSASMNTLVTGSSTALQIALALGIYCSDKLKGSFKDLVCTFSNTSDIYHIPGKLDSKINVLMKMKWGMNTNIQAAFKNILDVAVKNKVPAQDMPATILILSDMEFDACANNTNYKGMKDQYKAAGYTLPNLVFWNLNGRVGNSPVRFNKEGTALVSGFSPAILKSVLNGKNITPESIMLDTVMVDKYRI